MSTSHHLKTLPAYWDAIARGDKLFEVRKDDRAFQAGDILVLERYDADDRRDPLAHFQTMSLQRLVTFVLRGGQFGVEPGYVVLSLRDISGDDL